MLSLLAAILLVGALYGAWVQAREEAEIELDEEEFDHNEGEEIYDDEDL